MKLSTQHLLRLLLITVMVLAPVQSAFSMQMCMHTDSPAIATSDHVHSGKMSGEMQMFDKNVSNHGDCGNCQGSSQCGSCPMSLAVLQIDSMRNETAAQFHVTITSASLNSTDLLPDYRPPRFS